MNFYYIQSGNDYAPDKHLIDGLRENGHTVFELSENSTGFRKYHHLARMFLTNKEHFDAVFIGYTFPHFVPLIRALTFKKIIFNAVASQYEANIISRGNQSPWSITAIKWWLVDFLSFHLSSRVLLESNGQIDFVHKFFLVSRKKLVRAWIGVDEKIFFLDPAVKKLPEFTVLFRGRFLPESGIDTIIKSAKLLEGKGVNFLIIGDGFLYKTVNSLAEELHPKNLTMIRGMIPHNELREKMLSCHISLGQLADHPRLSRTLPFKLYESLALRLPYLTGKSAGVLELLEDGKDCVTISPGDPNILAQKILYLKDRREILKEIAQAGHNLYEKKLTSKILAKEVLIPSLNNSSTKNSKILSELK